MGPYSAKDAELSVKQLSFGWVGSIPTVPTKYRSLRGLHPGAARLARAAGAAHYIMTAVSAVVRNVPEQFLSARRGH